MYNVVVYRVNKHHFETSMCVNGGGVSTSSKKGGSLSLQNNILCMKLRTIFVVGKVYKNRQ